MALVVKDRVQETTTTTGTGTITLAGAVTGFQSFSVIGDANTTYYTIAAGSEFEVGIGTYTALGTTLSRDTVLESSNAGALVNFSAGIKNVFVTYPAEKSLYLDASNNAIGLGTVATTTTLTNAVGLPLTTGVTGTLGATNGGTAQSTYATGNILYASATNTLAKLAIGTSGQVLKVSAGGIPEWAAAGDTSSLTITDFTASASQTTFTVAYTVGLLEGVYRNGVKLGLADYTASNGTTVVLGTGATSGDLIQVVAFSAVVLANTVSTISFGSTGLTPSTATNGDVSVAGTLAVANGGTGAVSQTAYGVLCGGTTSTGAYQSIASVGSAAQVLTSNGAGALPTFQTPAPGGTTIPAGTVMLFGQTAAPTGFTKLTDQDNAALRVVSGSASTGGSQGFTTAFASQTPTGSVSITAVSGTAGSTTLTTPQIPSHTHTFPAHAGNFGPVSAVSTGGLASNITYATSATGGGGSHDHPFSFTSGSGTFSGNAINLAVKYVDVIRATKD
jgi:hypothetical protein